MMNAINRGMDSTIIKGVCGLFMLAIIGLGYVVKAERKAAYKDCVEAAMRHGDVYEAVASCHSLPHDLTDLP